MQISFINIYSCFFILLLVGCYKPEINRLETFDSLSFEIDKYQTPKKIIYYNPQDKLLLENKEMLKLKNLLKQLYSPDNPIMITSVIINNTSYPLEVKFCIDEVKKRNKIYWYTFKKEKNNWILVDMKTIHITL